MSLIIIIIIVIAFISGSMAPLVLPYKAVVQPFIGLFLFFVFFAVD